ncbi:hypothetical protein SK355_02975 [Candidatus Fukatsuia symbiotica]|uniref:Integrase n=1 Tax=Candidatus Fukatsuia symbiotica TaxID=1878942 RepID=A0A2U8I2S0_9GAMM|nr:hypothetical protein [Candidatus Fukatsuia symbiotica]AWK13403.1 hypothetical protein CCS41_01065 [Candidatus Fukatsuia symbiotica]MEA9444295.1 hypothetical protein [Candidatus Fukatsuia symbiotica]
MTGMSASSQRLRNLKGEGGISARLYSEARDKDFVQKLLGHKPSAMTNKYHDSRGSEWDEI